MRECEITEAIREAHIMECACDRFDIDHMLKIATGLSGAKFDEVRKIYRKKFEKSFKNVLTT